MSRPAVPEPAWWCEDPERWELLEFDGRHDDDGRPVDIRWEDREQVLEALILRPEPGIGDFARYLLAQETESHGHSWGFRHSIELAALLVAEERRTEDVWLLWNAVCRSFDTWCGLPHRLLLSAGAARTVEYVSGSEHPQRDNLLGHLEQMDATDDDEVARTLTERRRYYSAVLRELAGE
ncbi:hypothetical protein OG401_00395 [Kitasatospora purpeofusca]|uniref:hypothetical protein n=1 Tax=Kitasatospora purpeofusca TaxID=67352 RepID=UPI00224D3347|nr:hypothetical protein [Kitasatospora purpeofusca]MCX4682782.1 hypothetical protein [Kitasatospora purpeofusca]